MEIRIHERTSDKDAFNTETDSKRSETDSSNACEHDSPLLSPPDGGWGWIVTMATFMIVLIADGIAFSFGFFVDEFQRAFDCPKSVVSALSSLLNGVCLSSGPVVAALVNRFGCRDVAMFGAMFTALCFFLSTFSPNIATMLILYGILGGFGLGLLFLPGIVLVGQYFDRRRAFATGTAFCGSGFGSLLFSLLSEHLLQEYTWQGAIWILSALIFHGAVFAALFRPIRYTKSQSVTIYECDKDTSNDMEKSTFLDKPSFEVSMSRSKSSESCNNIANEPMSLYLCEKPKCKDDTSQNDLHNPLLKKKDALLSGRLSHFKEATNQDITNESGSFNKQSKADKGGCLDVLKDMVDFSLLKSPTFSLYGMTCFMCNLGFFVPFVYIPGVGISNGLSSLQMAWIISMIGIVNTFSRVAIGYVSDKTWADCILIKSVALMIGGILTMFVPFFKHFSAFALYAVVYGVTQAAFISLRSIILVEVLGIEFLTKSFGLISLCMGITSSSGPPIAGAFYDMTGDYHASFYLAGGAGCFFVVVVVVVFVRMSLSTPKASQRLGAEEEIKTIEASEL